MDERWRVCSSVGWVPGRLLEDGEGEKSEKSDRLAGGVEEAMGWDEQPRISSSMPVWTTTPAAPSPPKPYEKALA